LYKNDPRPDPNEIVEAANVLRGNTGANRICITGGEPFLQDNVLLRAVVTYLTRDGFTVDLFTNGTLPFDTWVVSPKVTVCMDWKLAGSGEGSVAIDKRVENYTILRQKDAVKFIVKNNDDLWEAVNVFKYLMTVNEEPRFYVGAVWGNISDAEIVDFIMQHQLPWWLNVQVHKHVWEETTRGV
jgi:organic radical activating enzyme